MKQRILATIAMAPLVFASIAAGLWLAVAAAYENVRLSHATSQILGVLSAARDVSINPSISPDRATYDLLMRLSHNDHMLINASDPVKWPTMVNPWGEPMLLMVEPAVKQITMDTRVSSPVCQHILAFLAKDIHSLGIKRIDVRDDEPTGWGQRNVLTVPDENTARVLSPLAISVGCGDQKRVVLRLTFNLR